MPDPRIENLAQVLVDYSLQIRPGDLLRLRGGLLAEPLIREVFRQTVRRGAHAFVDVSLPGLSEIFFKEASDAALDWTSPIEQFKAESITADLLILADTNTQELSGVDPIRMARWQQARTPIVDRWRDRAFAEPPQIRWCITLVPTNALAQDAHLSLADYEDFVYHAMLLDTPDPVRAWHDLRERQLALCRTLAGTKEIRIVALDTDLHLRTRGRTWCSADGRNNFPDGEVFTAPLEDSAQGHIRYTYPTIHDGREAEDVQLWFEDGLVTRWEARRGKEVLDELFALDEGARRLGEFAIGNNFAIPAFTKNILFDEKIGGTCHLAVGDSIREAGGLNRSLLHWDMVCDLRQGALYADGELIHENGQWKI